MKTIFKLSFALVMSVFLWAPAAGQWLKELPKSWNYAVEIGGVLCGFSESEVTIMLIYSNTYFEKQKEPIESSYEIQSASFRN